MILNDKQRKLVEDNHSLIYWYAGKYKVPIEEYYDVLAMALCYAAYNYDESKGAFSTLAIKTMYFKMQHEFSYNTKKSKIPIDKIMHYENTYQMENMITSHDSPERITICKLSYNNMLNKILNLTDNEKHKKIIMYRLQGLTVQEIGKKVNISHQNVSCTLKRIKEKAKIVGIL